MFIFTVSKNKDLREWERYHLEKGFEIFVVNNGDLIFDQNPNFHLLTPEISENVGHTTQQEFLMNQFYKSVEKDCFIFFIDDDEFLEINEEITDSCLLNWKIFNGEFFPKTNLNRVTKVCAKSNQNLELKLHKIANKQVPTLKNSFIRHVVFTGVEEFNRKLKLRRGTERQNYLNIRIKPFFECAPLRTFQMCILMDDFNKIQPLRELYPNITFFTVSKLIPYGNDIESVPFDYWIVPELFIFKYALENHLDIVLKYASLMNLDSIEIDDEFEKVNLHRVIHHYPILKQSQKVISKFKKFGLFKYSDIFKFMLQFTESEEWESKSFMIEFSRFFSNEVDETIGKSRRLDMIKCLIR